MAAVQGRGRTTTAALPAPIEAASRLPPPLLPAPLLIEPPKSKPPESESPEPPAPEAATPDPAAAFREAAQGHALKALEMLAELMVTANSEAVRVSAANALIDRAYGRAAQAVRVGGQNPGGMGADEEGHVSLTFTWLDPAKS